MTVAGVFPAGPKYVSIMGGDTEDPMIEPLPDFPENVIAMTCRGHVTRGDYDTVLVPAVEAALADHDKIRLYYEIGPDFTGIEPAAVWEDFKVGMGHLTRWERIAVVTDVDWIRNTIQAFRFLLPGEMKVVPMAEAGEARAWIAAP
jgi:hypothetical protein